MPIVTALRATRRGRVSVHVDGDYLCTVDEPLVARLRLHEQRELSPDEVDELCRAADAGRVLADAYRLLGHRARGTEELRRRLLDKGHPDSVVGDVIDRLAAEGLLDDEAFARAYVADKRRLASWGDERIRRGLVALGLGEAAILAALSAGSGTESARPPGHAASELERALAVLARRGPPKEPLQAARRRAFDALRRRGYSSAVAYEAVRAWSRGASPHGV